MNTFCTIITADYIPFARVLFHSLEKQQPGCLLHIFIAGEHSASLPENIIPVTAAEIARNPLFRSVEKKYAHTSADLFRWSMKPILIGYLLDKGYDKVIYVDPDIYFVGDFGFILELLGSHAVVLTPHWADLDITLNEDSVLSILRNGIFNAGFIGVSQKGQEHMKWWAGMCHFKMEKREDLGVYVDQRYLDLLQVQFENVHVLENQGCNLAAWNIQSCKRALKDGRLLINGKFEPVFIHFTGDTIINIVNRNDALLKDYLDEYYRLLADNGMDLLQKPETIASLKYESVHYKLRHRLKIQTRLKRFFYRLAEKL